MRATGADGGVRFAGMAAGRYQLARVLHHERFATFDLAHWVELGAGREEVRDLAPPGKVRLLGEWRSLAAPSEATYVRGEPGGDPPGKARASRAAFVHDGSFVIDGLESGTWSLRATPLGRPGAGPGAERRIDVAPGTSGELRVVLELRHATSARTELALLQALSGSSGAAHPARRRGRALTLLSTLGAGRAGAGESGFLGRSRR